MTIGQYVIVSTRDLGTFSGALVGMAGGGTVTLARARHLRFWSGANSVYQLAAAGTAAPEQCRFTEPVPEIVLLEATEVIATTPAGQKSIESVPHYTAQDPPRAPRPAYRP